MGANDLPRFVVIDDSSQMLDLYRELLRDQFPDGVAITDFAGPPPLDELAACAPDAVLLDVRLHASLDGLELMRAMRDDPALSSIPIVVITASHQGIQQLTEELPDGVEVLVKPFSLDAFYAMIRRAMLRGGASRPDDAGRVAALD